MSLCPGKQVWIAARAWEVWARYYRPHDWQTAVFKGTVREECKGSWTVEFDDGSYVFTESELTQYVMPPHTYTDEEVRCLVLRKIRAVLRSRFCLFRSKEVLRLLSWNKNSCFVDAPAACELAVAEVVKARLPVTSCLPRFYIYLLGVMDACCKDYAWADQARDIFRAEVCTTRMDGDGSQGTFGDPMMFLLACIMDGTNQTPNEQLLWEDFRMCIVPWRVECPHHPGLSCGRGGVKSLFIYLPWCSQIFGKSRSTVYTSIQEGLVHLWCSGHSESTVCSVCGGAHFKCYDLAHIRLPEVLMVKLINGPGSMRVNTRLVLGRDEYTLISAAYYINANHWAAQIKWQDAWNIYNYRTKRCGEFNRVWHAKELSLLWYTRTTTTGPGPHLKFANTFIASVKTGSKCIIDLSVSD
jgi:hypothetical protein